MFCMRTIGYVLEQILPKVLGQFLTSDCDYLKFGQFSGSILKVAGRIASITDYG